MASKIASRILDVAVERFALSGYHGATTKAICDQADVTEGSLFRLFTSKEKLFEAALREELEHGRLSTSEISDILESDENFERGLTKAMLACFERMSQRYIRIAIFAVLEHPELARSYLMSPSQSVTRAVARTIEREIYRRKLRSDIDPIIAALQLVTSLWQMTFVAPILPAEFRLDTRSARRSAVEKFVEIWLHGMEIKTKPASKKRRKK
jgi:AcrR family transcriptional regulator